VTVAQLEQALARKKARLDALVKRRRTLQSQLEGVERKLEELGGRNAETVTRRRRKRSKNAQSLRDIVLGLLTKHRKGQSMAELQEAVRATGYKSQSTNFRNVMYQCLYYLRGVKHDRKTGKYVLTR